MYHCIQESKVFMINLLPEEKCTCIEKKGCSHILAVKHYNGFDIKTLYKTPLLSQLTQNKNNNHKSGSKFKYHKQNSIKPADRLNLDLNKQIETDIQNQESKYLFELVADGSLVINDYIKRKAKFTDPLLLTDLFILDFRISVF